MENFVPELLLGGVSGIVAVVLIVESLKRLGFAGEDTWLTPQRAALLSGIVLGGLALAVQLPITLTVAVVVDAIAANLFAGIAAGLAYDLVGDAFFARLQAVTDAILSRE